MGDAKSFGQISADITLKEELAKRCEEHPADAAPADTAALMEAVFESVKGPIRTSPRPGTTQWHDNWFDFRMNLRNLAWESAALMLMPPLADNGVGWHTFLAAQDRHSGRWNWELRNAGWKAAARANTMAMAICAVVLRTFK